MNSKLHWQQLSAAIFASLLLSSPAYAEVSHSQEVTLTKNGVQTQSGEVGTIEVTEEAKEGIGTGTGITDDSQKRVPRQKKPCLISPSIVKCAAMALPISKR